MAFAAASRLPGLLCTAPSLCLAQAAPFFVPPPPCAALHSLTAAFPYQCMRHDALYCQKPESYEKSHVT